MKKFSLEEYLSHPEKKVVTFCGYPVTIYRTDFKDKEGTPIMGSYIFEDGMEYCAGWSSEGRFRLGPDTISSDLDLFFADEEPEMSEFEKAVRNCYTRDASGKLLTQEELVARAKELLGLAKKQLIPEFAKLWAEAKDRGRKEALNDLPRWKRDFNRTPNFRMFPHAIVDKDYYYLEISSLEHLPKED